MCVYVCVYIYICIFCCCCWLFFIVCLWLSLHCGTCTSLVVGHGFCSWCPGLSCPMACGILHPWSEIEPGSPALEAWILNQDKQESFLCISLFMFMYIMRYQSHKYAERNYRKEYSKDPIFSHSKKMLIFCHI